MDSKLIYISFIQGEKGDRGAKGVTGSQGYYGPKGAKGYPGSAPADEDHLHGRGEQGDAGHCQFCGNVCALHKMHQTFCVPFETVAYKAL